MNVFFLHCCAVIAAKQQCNKHVVKMIIEATQLLSAALRWLYGERPVSVATRKKRGDGGTQMSVTMTPNKVAKYSRRFDALGIYGLSQASNPLVVWARSSEDNFLWLLLHAFAIANEYYHRYGAAKQRVHACFPVLVAILNFWDSHMKGKNRFPQRGLTTPPECMPDEYKWQPTEHGQLKTFDDVVQSYRRYYIGAKQSFAKWPADPPDWWIAAIKPGLQSTPDIKPDLQMTPDIKPDLQSTPDIKPDSQSVPTDMQPTVDV